MKDIEALFRQCDFSKETDHKQRLNRLIFAHSEDEDLTLDDMQMAAGGKGREDSSGLQLDIFPRH